MIRKFFTNNIGLKIAAVFIAVLIWLVVVNVSNPEITNSKQVTVEVVNDEVLTAIGKTYEFTGSRNVMVSYNVRTRDEQKIHASDFRAYVDLKNIYDVTSSVPIVVEVVNNRDLIIGEPVAKPTVLHIDVEEIIYKTFNIDVNTTGEQREGYTIGSIAINPTVVQVSGPSSEVNAIASAAITIDISGVGEDTSGNAKIVYYDAGGRTMSLDERLESSRTNVDFYISTLGGKSVPVQFSSQGQPMDGYSLVSVDSNIKELTVMGAPELLDSFGSIAVPGEYLDITGATESRSVQVDLSAFVPQGLTIVSDSFATVTAAIVPRNERVFALTWDDIKKTGLGPGNTYQLDPSIIYIALGGNQAELNRLSVADLGASIDFTGMNTGVHVGTLVCEIANVYEVKAVTSFNIVVNGGVAVEELVPEETEGTTENAETTEMTGEEETLTDAGEAPAEDNTVPAEAATSSSTDSE